MNIRPLFDKVLVEPTEAEGVTDGGILLPDSAREEPKSGTVLAVGEGRFLSDSDERIPMSVKVGDKVLFIKRYGSEIRYGKRNLRLLAESDILAVEEEVDDV